MDMGKPETSANEAAVAENPADVLRLGIGGHVKVLGLAAEQQIAHAATHQQGLIALLLEAIEHLEGILD